MPGMDGFAFVERIQELPACAGVPIVILTAMELGPEELARIHRPQIRKILRKGGCSRTELMALVRALVLPGPA